MIFALALRKSSVYNLITSGLLSKLISTTRYLIGFVLLTSGLFKIFDLTSFQTAIYKLAMIYDAFVPFISIAVPVAELILGLFLLVKFRTYYVIQFVIYLFVFFTSVLIVKLTEGTGAECGCFGNLIDNKIGFTTIIRNIVLLFLCYFIYLKEELNKNQSGNLGYIPPLKKNTTTFIIVAILCFLSVQNFTFAIQNNELKNRIYLLIGNETLMPGETIDQVNVSDLNKNIISLRFQNKKGFLIFIMQYGCNPCSENQKKWKYIYDILKNKIPILGISISNTELSNLLKKEKDINYPLYSAPGEEFKLKFKVFSTPQTILLSPDGTVEKIFKGVLDENDIDFFNSLK